ncbi:Uncharacterised protein [Legionella busanensis]|uniref:Oxidative stress defense protein n=1 Tax=Legionella busanensis TaxID=190655 RepID=A0A378JKD6_9GAMM|nr:hypothetical protein [Legionella busanensis]STX51796.1 Uncharacterised protein [Legionella busanensis]
MNNLSKIAVLFLLPAFCFANNDQTDIPLDKISFQVSARQWVTTQTALLTVDINATLTNADLVKARADIITNLNKIAAGDWHITQFNRSQDSSGLEKLFVEAQARISQSSLTNVYQNAKAVTQPGSTYSINTIDFKPSFEEVQKVKAQVRQRLYHLVKAELMRLNNTYKTQYYSVNNIYIMEGNTLPVPQQPRAYQAKEMINTMALGAAAPTSDVTVSNEILMSAVVDVASNRSTE